MPANYRRDPFTDADQAVAIVGERHTVPAASPFYVWLSELPREDDPASVVVREAPTVTDLQPDGTDGKDAYVYEDFPSTVYDSGILVVGRGGSPATGRYRTLLWFDLSGLTGSVTSAKLRLYLEDTTGSGGFPNAEDIALYRVTSTWSEASVTWGTAPTYDVVAVDVVAVYAAGWYEWDVTALVQGWLDTTWPNYGVLLANADESDTDNTRNFTSSDGSADYRPTLSVATSGATLTLVARTATPGPDQVAVSYERGALRLHEDRAGDDIEVDYYGTGSPVRAEDVGLLADLIGHGEDGALDVTSGTTTLAAGRKSYSSIYVAPGAVLRCTDPAAVIGVLGDVEVHGTIDLAGRGYAGGAGGGAGLWGRRGRGLTGGGGGQGTTNGALAAGGGGGGGSAEAGEDGTSGSGGTGGAGGDQAPTLIGDLWRRTPPLAGGGGGGGGGNSGTGGGAGGAGGGALLLQARGSIYVAPGAVLDASGAAGSTPDGGGGGGGVFWFRGASLDVQAVPDVSGGAGADLGGDGADGWWTEEVL